MADFLAALGLFLAVITTLAVAGWWLVMRSLRRANRVVATRRSGAPLAWLWSWRQPARLHRRLRRAVQVANGAVHTVEPELVRTRRGAAVARHRRANTTLTTPLHDVAADLVQRAVSVDDCLVAAARLPRPWFQHRLGELAAEVRELETLSFRLVQLTAQWRASIDQAVQPALPPPDIRERLDAVEAALQELPIRV